MTSGALHVAREVLRVLKENPHAFCNDPRLRKTLQEVRNLDRKFEETSGIFFETGSTAFKTARKFTEIHVKRYRKTGRPSLPALAVHHAEKMELDKNSPEYKALIMVAVRAEMKAAVTPEYHSKFHYMDVAAMTANLLEKNNEMVKAGVAGATPLTQQEQALTFIAAIGHDLDHDGRSNPKNDPLFNEKKSFHLMEPLLREAGLAPADIDKIFTILMTTSPDGPHAVLKAVAQARREGRPIDFSVIDPSNKSPELKVLGQDDKLTQMAAIVSDSDLCPSIVANKVMSALFTKEKKKEDSNIDLRTVQARKYFLDAIVGKAGFASNAGCAVIGKSLEALRKKTDRLLGRQQKPSSTIS